MSELKTLLQTWGELGDASRDAILATVVHVSGSAYRRPGARMLVLPHGRRVGTISGGCLEGEILRKAWWFTESSDAVVRVYDTSSGDDAVWEFGLGCNGVVHVMLERLAAREADQTLRFLAACTAQRRAAVVVTVIAVRPGAEAAVGERLLFDSDSIRGGNLAERSLASEALDHAARALHDRLSFLVHADSCDLFIEYLAPALRLVVFGAGDDAQPVVSMATQLGWEVTVVDGRPAYASSARFPDAAHIHVLRNEDGLDDVALSSDAAVVMMTHNYPLDVRLLPAIVAARPRYLGVLGPRHRAERLFSDAGVAMPPNLHAPVGLDLGGDSPSAIALSIVAEIQAAVAARSGSRLALRDSSIHAPVLELGVAGAFPRGAERPSLCEVVAGEHAA